MVHYTTTYRLDPLVVPRRIHDDSIWYHDSVYAPVSDEQCLVAVTPSYHTRAHYIYNTPVVSWCESCHTVRYGPEQWSLGERIYIIHACTVTP